MKVNVILVGVQPDEQTPQAAIYSVTPAGQIGKKLATIEKGSVEIPADVVKHKQAIIAVGPDTADATQLDAGALFQFRLADQLPNLQKNPVLEVPSQRWRLWLGLRICVAGSIRKCSPIIFEPAAIRRGALARIPYPPFEVCFPMCNGVVEVWEQTCCCFPIVIFELPSIIKRIKNLVDREPLKFPPPPPGDPSLIDRAALQNVNRALALGHVDFSVVPNTELYADLLTLQSLQADQALQFLQVRPSFWPFICRCTSAKKGETVLNPDGSFNFCFNEFPIFLFNCRRSYFYKVKQFQNGQWVYVYDGVASHQYFNADQFASLFTFRGQSCGQPPPPPGEDFATLQAIGFTPSYELNSHYAGQNAAGVDLTQTGATNLIAPPSDAGLLLGNGAPWGLTLNLQLYFHDGLQSPDIGAVYYRLSVVASDNNGNPLVGTTSQVLQDSVTWTKFVEVGGQFQTEPVLLGPNLVNGAGYLFTIPYGPDWENGQFHQILDTTRFANHNVSGNPRYMVVLELFDANGKRIVPQGAKARPGGVATDIEKPFNFLRLMSASGPGSTATVPFASLTHLFWFDNRSCFGSIEDFDVNAAAGSAECQFLKGIGDSQFQVGYRAFHTVIGDNNPPSRTFMESYSVTYQRGLNGPSGTLVSGGDVNEPASMFGGPNVKTPAVTFQSLLGDQTACSFAINLDIAAKHTNGFGRISTYDVHKEAAVAIEIV